MMFNQISVLIDVWIRFYADEIADLAVALCIPDPFRTPSRSKFSAVEALALLLARFRTAGDEHLLVQRFDRSQSAISEVVNALMIFLDDHWKHLLEPCNENPLLKPVKLAEYANAIHAAGSPLPTVWCFIDCMIRYMCRPSQYQRQAYNGYKGRHSLKFQALKLPNGMIGALFGPVEGRRNDNHLLSESKVIEWCYTHAFRPGADAHTPISHRYFHVFGDPAYGISPVLMSPFSGLGERTDEEKEWNEAMASVRIEVEHGFADIVRSWPFLNAWWVHRVYSSPVGRFYRIGVLLTNILNCIRPNQTAQSLECEPPTLEEYLQPYHTELCSSDNSDIEMD